MNEILEGIGIAANIAIAFGYLGIGMWVAPKFRGPKGLGLHVARISGLIFFITCALTHVDMGLHAALNVGMDYAAWHYIVNHVVQAIAAPVFLLAAYRSIDLSLEGR